jgi:hypothetical protein
VFQSNAKREGLQPIVNIVRVNSSEYNEVAVINKFTGQKQVQFTSMITDLVNMTKRNQLIVELIKRCREDDRRILVMSDRRNHLQQIKTLIDADSTVKFTSGLFVGQMKISCLEKSKACDVILATYQAFGEGVSERDLDTLILVTPKKYVGHLKNVTKNESGRLEQIVGRIFRKDHTEKNPLIIDINDNFSVYKNQSRQRKQFYKQHFKNLLYKEETIDLDQHEKISLLCVKTVKDDTINISCVESVKDEILTSSYCLLD